MACLNLTLNEDEILELLAAGDVNILFRHILQKACNRVLQLESQQQLGAESYERSSLRQDYRNGSRGRELKPASVPLPFPSCAIEISLSKPWSSITMPEARQLWLLL